MRQIKITTGSFNAEPDALLPDDDPMNEYLRTGDAAVFNKPRSVSLEIQAEEYNRKMSLAKEQGIKPGSPAWHLL